MKVGVCVWEGGEGEKIKSECWEVVRIFNM